MKITSFIDSKFKSHAGRYIFQCFLATLSIFFVLFFIDLLTHKVTIASLGATAFIVFTRPKYYSSMPRRLFGGYVVGASVGYSCYLLSQITFFENLIQNPQTFLIFWGAVAVGLSIFIMVVTDTEHPPCAGFALGMVIGEWDEVTILYIFAALLFMFILKKTFYPLLIDLI
ncbi:MAG: HPP family protein [Candidatus Aureabacteria bacterium]|nr:HPP family protein [Candidatus Auribacterota bacterium]